MSGVFDLRKLPALDVLVLVKLRDRSIAFESISKHIAEIAGISLTGPNKLSIKKMKLQILILDFYLERPAAEKNALIQKLKDVANVSFQSFGPFSSKREEAIATYNQVMPIGFSILVEVPSLNEWSSVNVLELIRPVLDGADFSVGQRALRLSPSSLTKLKLLNGYFWLRFGYPVGDWTSEYLSWRRWAVTSVDYQVLNASGFGYLAELKNRCLDKGFRARSVRLVGACPLGEFEFLQGIRPINEVRGMRSTL